MDENKKRWFSLFVLVMLPFMGALDANIVNVALPTIAKDLGVSMGDVEWIATTYLIVISATIIVFGRLGDVKGKILVFRFGFVLFILGSLLCGLSHTFSFLIFSRILQAIGASCAMATNQGIITQIFPPHQRGRALGISGMAVALGTMTGAPLGGLLVTVASWQLIFLVNIPVGIIASIMAAIYLPKEKRSDEEKSIFPLLDVSIFQNKLFSLSIFCAFLAFLATSSLNIIQPFYLQDILFLSPGTAGLFMMIFPVVTVFASPLSGYMSDKMGSEKLTFAGLCLEATGLFCYSRLHEDSSLVLIGAFLVVIALGSALFLSPNTSLVMSTVTREKLGVAGSVNALVRNLGMTAGIFISTHVLYNRMSANLGYKVSGLIPGKQEAFIYGMHWAYSIAALICLLGAVLTGIRLFLKAKPKLEIQS